MTERI